MSLESREERRAAYTEADARCRLDPSHANQNALDDAARALLAAARGSARAPARDAVEILEKLEKQSREFGSLHTAAECRHAIASIRAERERAAADYKQMDRLHEGEWRARGKAEDRLRTAQARIEKALNWLERYEVYGNQDIDRAIRILEGSEGAGELRAILRGEKEGTK